MLPVLANLCVKSHGPHPERRPGTGRRRNLPPEEWTIIHQGVYPAYISWDTFMANQARLRDNASQYTLRTRGAVREGNALLVGLVVCGRCGRQMHVRYQPALRYRCVARREMQGLPACLHLDGASIEGAVVEAFFQAIQPAELTLLEDGLAALQEEQAQRVQQHADQIKRAAYEAALAERQYRAVDPDNRSVAAELERRWELALRALAEAREAAQGVAASPGTPTLDPALRAQLEDLGAQLPALWTSGRLRPEQQRELLRSLIRRVVLTRPAPETVGVTIVWVSGALSRLTVQPPLGRNADLADYDRIVERVRELNAAGYSDRAMAQHLVAEGFHSARHTAVPVSLVRTLRRRAGWPSLYQRYRGHDRIAGRWTASGLARSLGVTREWIYQRIASGLIPATRLPVAGRYLIADDPELLAQLRAQVTANT
jgi:hypothetical protein